MPLSYNVLNVYRTFKRGFKRKWRTNTTQPHVHHTRLARDLSTCNIHLYLSALQRPQPGYPKCCRFAVLD